MTDRIVTGEREALREALDALDIMVERQTLTGAVRVRDIVRAALAQAEAAPDEPATDDDIERWYAAFEKVSGSEAKTFQGRAQIYWRFAAEYARLSSEPTETGS